MGLSPTEQRQLRALVEDIRTENPRLARVMLRKRNAARPGTEVMRIVAAVVAVIAGVVLMVIGTPLACLLAVLLYLGAATVLGPPGHDRSK